MMSKMIRWPKIGDLIIQKSDRKKYMGIVYEEKKGRVFIEWSDGQIPPDYWRANGYLAMNIHNLYATFDIIKTHV